MVDINVGKLVIKYVAIAAACIYLHTSIVISASVYFYASLASYYILYLYN